jgi:hypothetical protein
VKVATAARSLTETLTSGEWRLEQLLNAGWPEDKAAALALSADVDLHRACDLLRQGCALELAWEILR